MTSYCRTPVTYTAHQRAIVGDTKMSVIGNDHLGWMKCDGRTLNVNDYYLLWRVIGYAFGSNGTSNTFKLPNAAGRVPGVVGTGIDSNTSYSTLTLALGDSIGEYSHRLNIDEMPSHTHGSSNVTGDSNGNGFTTSNGLHTHTITDPGHTHTYLGVNSQGAASGGDNVAENSPRPTEITSSNTTGITINSNGEHNHEIFNTGGSNWHNNIQPMIGLGNMFIFSGKYMYPSDASVPFAGYPYLSNSQIL
jgi:microcystin-dependent protein